MDLNFASAVSSVQIQCLMQLSVRSVPDNSKGGSTPQYTLEHHGSLFYEVNGSLDTPQTAFLLGLMPKLDFGNPIRSLQITLFDMDLINLGVYVDGMMMTPIES